MIGYIGNDIIWYFTCCNTQNKRLAQLVHPVKSKYTDNGPTRFNKTIVIWGTRWDYYYLYVTKIWTTNLPYLWCKSQASNIRVWTLTAATTIIIEEEQQKLYLVCVWTKSPRSQRLDCMSTFWIIFFIRSASNCLTRFASA